MSKKKIALWSLGSLLALIVIIVVAALLILRTQAFRNYVISKVISQTDEATGGKLEISNFAFRLSGLHADLYGVTLHGTESGTARPLLLVDHIGVTFKILSVLHAKVNIQDITIDHPVANYRVSAKGENNVPVAPKKKESKPVDVFQLAIGHVALNRGEVYYNDRKLNADADIHNLETKIAFSTIKTSYDGTLSYNPGRIRVNGSPALESSLDAAFSATPSGARLEKLLLTTSRSRVLVQASMNNYSNPLVEATYDVTLDTQDVQPLLAGTSLPTGQIVTKGSVRYSNPNHAPLMNVLYVDGSFESPSLPVNTAAASTDIQAIRGHYHLEDGNVVADGIRADLLGGSVLASLRMNHLENNPDSHASAKIEHIALGALSNAAASHPLEGMPIRGTLNGTVDAAWRGSIDNLKARSDLSITGSTTSKPGTGAVQPIPVNASVHLNYDGARKLVALNQSYIRTPHTQVEFNGTASERSSIQIQMRSDDLHELDALALPFRRASAAKNPKTPPPHLLGLYGSGTLIGHLQGRTDAVRFTGDLALNEIQLQQTHLQTVHTSIEASPNGAALHSGLLQADPQNRVRFDVAVGLHKWSYSPSEPISAQVSTTRFQVADLERLAGLNYPITGLLTVNISVHGTQLQPQGQGNIQLAQATLWNQPIQRLQAQFQGTRESLHSNLDLQTPAGNATASVVYNPKNQGYQMQLNVPALRLDQLQTVRDRDLGITGVLSVSGSGQGTIQRPQLQITAQIPQLHVREQQISGVSAQLSVADQQAHINFNSNINSSIANTYLQASATVSLKSDYYTTAKIDSRSIPLGPLLASYLPGNGRDFHGQTEVHAALNGPLKDPSRVQAHLELPIFNVGYQSIQVEAAGPIRLDYRNGLVTLQRTQIKGPSTNLQLQGEVPVKGGGLLRVFASGTMDLSVVRLFNPDMDSSGQLTLNATATGDRAHPTVQGQIRIVNAGFQVPDAPLGLSKLNGDLELRNDHLYVTHLSGETGGGTVSASGSIAYSPAVQFNLGLTANNIRLRYPEGVRTILRSQLAMNGGMDSAAITGQVQIQRLSFTPDFDLSTFVGQFSEATPSGPSTGFTNRVKLNISIQTTQGVNLESAKLSIQGSANLRAVGTVADPVILGRANLTGGEVFFLSNRYQIQNGVIDFVNPVRTEPVVNLTVSTVVNQYTINLSFMGPVDRMRTSYSSDPSLPPVDIINLLAFGKTTEESAASPSTPTNLGAESLLAQGVTSQLSSRVEKFAGISHLSIDPNIGGNQQNPGARIAIQQRVTKNLFFTFATDVTSTQNEIVQVEYQITKGWSVSVIRDQNGGYALDAKRRKTF